MPSRVWLRIAGKTGGPFGQKLVRHSLHLGWLPKETEIAEDPNGPWRTAAGDETLWSESREIAVLKRHFAEGGLAGEKVSISEALGARLRALGWPGDVALLKNYYWSDRMPQDLEKERTPPLPLFDDPDWPKCWSAGSPAEVARKEALVPATPAQLHCLEYFLGPHHGIETKQTASKKLDEIFADPKKRARWEASKYGERATERQVQRLQWWAAQMGRSLPAELDKEEASSLIDRWREERPELLPLWEAKKEQAAEQKEDAEAREADVEIHLGWIDEWREIHHCRQVPKQVAASVIDQVGFRSEREGLDIWTRRFFGELRRVRPDLFSAQPPRDRRRGLLKPAGCVGMVVVGIVILAVGCAYLLAG